MSNLIGRGGPDRGQGRKTNGSKGMESKRIVIHVSSESEYNTIIKNTTPRMRTKTLLTEITRKLTSATPCQSSPTCL